MFLRLSGDGSHQLTRFFDTRGSMPDGSFMFLVFAGMYEHTRDLVPIPLAGSVH